MTKARKYSDAAIIRRMEGRILRIVNGDWRTNLKNLKLPINHFDLAFATLIDYVRIYPDIFNQPGISIKVKSRTIIEVKIKGLNSERKENIINFWYDGFVIEKYPEDMKKFKSADQYDRWINRRTNKYVQHLYDIACG